MKERIARREQENAQANAENHIASDEARKVDAGRRTGAQAAQKTQTRTVFTLTPRANPAKPYG
jgi:hypothetical protein